MCARKLQETKKRVAIRLIISRSPLHPSRTQETYQYATQRNGSHNANGDKQRPRQEFGKYCLGVHSCCPAQLACIKAERISDVQDKAEKMVRDAAAAGANVILLQVSMGGSLCSRLSVVSCQAQMTCVAFLRCSNSIVRVVAYLRIQHASRACKHSAIIDSVLAVQLQELFENVYFCQEQKAVSATSSNLQS